MTSSKRPPNPDRIDGSASLTMSNRCRPPTRASTSTLSRWTGNPTGPYHRANWSGSVNAWKTRAGGASTTRVISMS
jgi:hypothetical protein